MGIENITAVDGNQARLDFALRMGATKTVNFMEHKGIEELTKAVEDSFDGHLADFAFQCTGNPKAHANIYKFIRNGGGLCELGFFINGGDAQINPHFDLLFKRDHISRILGIHFKRLCNYIRFLKESKRHRTSNGRLNY